MITSPSFPPGRLLKPNSYVEENKHMDMLSSPRPSMLYTSIIPLVENDESRNVSVAHDIYIPDTSSINMTCTYIISEMSVDMVVPPYCTLDRRRLTHTPTIVSVVFLFVLAFVV